MKKNTFIILLLVILTGCSNKSDTVNIIPKQIPSLTPSPVIATTSIPTLSPTPTPIILPDTSEVSYFAYSGKGDDVISDVITDFYATLKFTSDNERHKSLKAHYNDDYDLLVNTNGSYVGYTLLFPEKDYTLEINAKENWEIEITNLGTSSTDSFEGIGDYVTPVFISSSDVYKVTSSGEGHFAVKGYYGNGNYDLLVNTTDVDYEGKVMFNQKNDYCFFTISGEREWTISPQ